MMRWTKRDNTTLIKNYGIMKNKVLATKLNRSIESIRSRARDTGLCKKRNYLSTKFDKDFFKYPGYKNAYWAGFIAADGCITRKGNTVNFNLAVKDRLLLEALAETTKYQGNIRNIEYTFKNNTYYGCGIDFCDAVGWREDLDRLWNLRPLKTDFLDTPNVTQIELLYQYIIGFIDGDGHIGLYPAGKTAPVIELQIVGNYDFLMWVDSILRKIEAGKETYKTNIVYRKATKQTFQLKYSSRRAYNILKKLSEIKTPFRLERKWSKISQYEILYKDYFHKLKK